MFRSRSLLPACSAPALIRSASSFHRLHFTPSVSLTTITVIRLSSCSDQRALTVTGRTTPATLTFSCLPHLIAEMDYASLMSNPMVGQLMARLQSDPDLMGRMQQLMNNPAGAQQAMANDPELQSIMQQFMGGGGGMGGAGGMGGMGGMGGGGGIGGGFGDNPWGSAISPTPAPTASSASSSSGHSYIDIHSESQYQSAVASAGKRLVVVDVTASWCGPCRRIAPVFAELSNEYKGRCVFLKVDGDENQSLMRQLGCSSFPTFLFFVDGKEIDRFSGADERRLRTIVREHGEVEKVKSCPYRHFPLKENEQVKYADMKWEAVEAKVDEYNAVVGEPHHLSALERAELDVVIQKLQNKLNYHSSVFNDAQYNLIRKVRPPYPTSRLNAEAIAREPLY